MVSEEERWDRLANGKCDSFVRKGYYDATSV